MIGRYRTMDIDGVSIPDGRDFDPAMVETLMISMAEIGLLNPISVQREGHQLLPFWLVAGRNRLEAARRLGWETINAIEIPFDRREDDAYALAKIAENLHRGTLSALERAELQAEWVQIVGRKVAQLAPPIGGTQPNDKGVRKAARDLGVSRDQLQRSTKMASLSPDAKAAARAAGLDDNQSALLAAAKEAEPKAQVAAIEKAAARKSGRPKPDPEADARHAIIGAFSRLSVTDDFWTAFAEHSLAFGARLGILIPGPIDQNP